jgi:hypothetical protein
MFALMQYALFFYDLQLILAQMGPQGNPGATASGPAAEQGRGVGVVMAMLKHDVWDELCTASLVMTLRRRSVSAP